MGRRVWAWALAAGACTQLVACGGGGGERVPDDPVGTARALIGTAKRQRCAEAWNLLSDATRRSLQARARIEIRQAPYYVDSFAPTQLLCAHTILANCDPESPRLDSSDGERAVVVVTRLEARDFRLPGFFPRSREPVPDTLHFVRDAGRWRLELVMRPPPDHHWDEEIVGGVAVRSHAYGGKTTVWIEGAVDAPVKSIEAVVADVAAWRRLLPWIAEVAPLPAPARSADGIPFWARENRHDRHVRLRIAPPRGTPIVTVVRLRPYADGSSSACCFGVGGSFFPDGDGTPIGVGELSLVAYPDGEGRTLMQLAYQLEAGRVPAEIADRMRSAEDVAALFDTIGCAARTR